MEHGVDDPPTSVADDKERMELYLYPSLYLHSMLQDELYHYLTYGV